MQPFVAPTKSTDVEDIAGLLMDVGPLVMRTIRRHAREHAAPDVPVSQFRTLLFLRRHAGASLTRVAEFHGLSLSTTSKLVDGLVHRGLVTREQAAEDRRRMTLALTEAGESLLKDAYERGRAVLAERLQCLTPEERESVAASLTVLHGVLAPPAASSAREPAELDGATTER